MSNTLASDTVVSITEEAEDYTRWKNEVQHYLTIYQAHRIAEAHK